MGDGAKGGGRCSGKFSQEKLLQWALEDARSLQSGSRRRSQEARRVPVSPILEPISFFLFLNYFFYRE